MKYTYWPKTSTSTDNEYFSELHHQMDKHCKITNLLNYTHPQLVDLVERQKWLSFSKKQRLAKICAFVKNEIVFGYNTTDNIPASRVLLDGLGSGISKSILMMALLRKCRIPCRFHAVTIDKKLYKRTITGLAYYLAPRNLMHSWVEVYVECKWVKVVGYMLDHVYLQSIQKQNTNVNCEDIFFDYEITASRIKRASFEGQNFSFNTQKQWISYDFGVFDSPDEFYRKHASELSFIKSILFKHFAQNRINSKLAKIRRSSCHTQGGDTANHCDQELGEL